MALYCYWTGSGTPTEPTFPGPDDPPDGWTCVDIPDEIVVPPEDPAEGEEDPAAEITLPDGSTVSATALIPPFVGLKEIAWHGEPWKVLWGVRTDGLLVGCTYDKDEDVWAWHRHPMSNGAVVSVCVIPSATDEQSELWAIIQREVGGNTVHYVERMTPRIQPEDENDKSRFNFLDSSLTYSGSATTAFTGADHLAGLTCRVWADGVDVGDVEVSGSGEFTLDTAAAEVVIGIHTNSTLISLPTARLATERQIVQSMVVRFFETLGGYAGTLHGTMEELSFRTVTDYMDDSPPLRDGDFDVTVSDIHDDKGVYTIIQNSAGPMTILAVFPKYKAA